MDRLSKTVFAVALLIAVAVFAVSVSDYGMVTRYGWLIWLFILVLVVGHSSFRRGGASAFLMNLALAVILGFVGMLVGDWSRRAYCYSKCRSCEPMLERLAAFRASHGAFPTNIPPLEIPRGLTIQQRSFSGGNINLAGVNQSDATLYLDTNGFLCVVPVTKVLPMSFTRFYAYMRNEEDRDWRYDYIISYLGSLR